MCSYSSTCTADGTRFSFFSLLCHCVTGMAGLLVILGMFVFLPILLQVEATKDTIVKRWVCFCTIYLRVCVAPYCRAH